MCLNALPFSEIRVDSFLSDVMSKAPEDSDMVRVSADGSVNYISLEKTTKNRKRRRSEAPAAGGSGDSPAGQPDAPIDVEEDQSVSPPMSPNAPPPSDRPPLGLGITLEDPIVLD